MEKEASSSPLFFNSLWNFPKCLNSGLQFPHPVSILCQVNPTWSWDPSESSKKAHLQSSTSKISWFNQSMLVFGFGFGFGRGKRAKGFTWQKFDQLQRVFASCHPLSGLQPPSPSQGVSLAPLLTQSKSFSLCGSSHPYPLASLLFTDLSKLMPLPLAQGRDADPLSVCINTRVLMIVTYLKHLKASSHKKLAHSEWNLCTC